MTLICHVASAVAQGSHVSVLASRNADDTTVETWINNGGKKIVLSGKSEEQLLNIFNEVENLPKAKIRDLGYTELDPNTLTAIAIGPANESDIDRYTDDLDLFK